MSDTWSQSKTQAGWIGRRDIKNVTFYGEAIYEDLPVLLNAPTKLTHAANKDYVDACIQHITHNATLNIQGGAPDEYYHLTAAQHTAVSTLDTTYARLDGATFTGDVEAFKINGWAYHDYTVTMPAAGGTASVAHGLTIANIRTFEATCLSSGYEVAPRGYISADGTRTAHYDVYADPTNLILVADATIAAAWVGQPVYIRVWYLA